MERDFMGLNLRESVVVVKEEVSDPSPDSAPTKAPGSQWPFANKVSAIPHFTRHMFAQEDSSNNTDASSGFAQNRAVVFVKQSHAPSAASIAGLHDPWNNSAGSPAQMTIFYNGAVKVYDSITPEKAQAIIFLAGNGSCLVNSDTGAGAQVRLPAPKFDGSDVLAVNQHVNGQPSSAMSSPVSISSHGVAQSVSSCTSTDELVPTPSPFSPDCKMDPPTKPLTPLCSAAAAASMMPRGIPQFRKVSLARFLEKRKERAMNAAPYIAAREACMRFLRSPRKTKPSNCMWQQRIC